MSDETTPDTPDTPENPDVATATETETEKAPVKLKQQVEIKDIGPCKKHIKIAIDREMIEERIGEKVKDLVKDSQVQGFRPGKAPRKIVEKRFAKDIGEQVKNELLFASLEQLAEDHDIAPLTAPNIDPLKIELPKEGPLVYEFEVEVRPQFDLPEYKGLKLKRPVKTYTTEEVQEEKRRILAPAGQIVPKPDGVAALGDILVAELIVKDGDEEVNKLPEQNYKIENRLVFKDAVIEKFGEAVTGAKAGDTRTVDLTLSSVSADPERAGKTLQAVFQIKDVKTVRMPDMTEEFLATNFGVANEEQLDELIMVMLNRRLEHLQRRSAREQVVEKIAASSQWDLPEDLLLRQARKALTRRVMEMRADGIPEDEIVKRQKLLQQNILQSTALALKEHFVLQKIAETEKIDISDDDINDEIERLAAQSDESPRRLRARLERDDLLDSLAAEMIERKTLDLILDAAEYEDVPLDAETHEELADDVEAVEEQTIPGEIQDPTLQPPALEETPEEQSEEKKTETAS
jgi:trigger factor